jgi:hypothetical protein
MVLTTNATQVPANQHVVCKMEVETAQINSHLVSSSSAWAQTIAPSVSITRVIPSLANLNAAFRMVVSFALLNKKRVHPRQCRQTNNPLLKERPTLLHFARLRQVLLDKTYAHGLQTMHAFLTLMGSPHAARAPKAVTLGQARSVNHAARRT